MMSKEYFQDATARIAPRPLAPFGFYLAANVAYFTSLRPASSPAEMNASLGWLGFLLTISVVCFSAFFWMTFLSPSSNAKVGRTFLLMVLTVGAWYFYDNGNRLDKHGSYNLLIFCIIFVVANFFPALLYVWYMCEATLLPSPPKRFWTRPLAASAVFAFVVFLLSAQKEAALNYGFFGQTMPCSEAERLAGQCNSCAWDRGTPWFDLVPFRLNFFVGSMTCPKDASWSASFEQGKLVVENCNAPSTDVRSFWNDSIILHHGGPTYSFLPRTETWGLPLKADSLDSEFNNFQKNVLEYVEQHTFPYSGPVASDTEYTILVRCGSAPAKLVNRMPPPAVKDLPVQLSSPGEDGLNLVTIFLDAVSRRHFHRRLPETKQTLERLTAGEDAEADLYEFFRYHTVGLNTRPNTGALWAGLQETNSQTSGKPIWEQFERAGYVSARIDSLCQDWNAYYNTGHVPNMTTVDSQVSHEYISWSCLPPYLPLGKHWAGNFAGATSIKARCISDTHVGWHMMDWMTEYIQHYTRDTPRAFSINANFMEGHEGSGEVLRTLDERLSRFLNPITSPINYTNTAVVIVSDHGALMGLNNAFFENGKIESANPMALMLVPNRWASKSQRGENLEASTAKLVTGHDIYETMRGFIATGKHETEHRRGVDLAHEKLLDRTCEEAGITETLCRCQ